MSDEQGLLELLLHNDDFRTQRVNIPKFAILLDNGDRPDKIAIALAAIYPQIVTKISLQLALKPSKAQKAAQGKTGFVVVLARWVIESTNAWVERCRSLVKKFERTLTHRTANLHLCFLTLMLKRLLNS